MPSIFGSIILYKLSNHCPGPAKVCSHACTAIDWTMPVLVGVFTAQTLQGDHFTDIGAQREQPTPTGATDCGSRKGELPDSIADFETMHDPWVYGSSNPFSAHVAHVLPSNAAVAAAGDCGSTSSALSVSGKGLKTTHCTG